MLIGGKWIRNFGSDSFLGLDQHPRVEEAVMRGVSRLGHAQRHVARLFQHRPQC